MNKLFTLLVILTSVVLSAQNPVEKTIGQFTELKVFDLIQVKLVKSKENKIVISGNHSEDVLVNNKNGKLKIKMNLEKSFDGDGTKVTLYYTSVDILDANEGATIYSSDNIKQYEIDLKSQEGGKINVNFDVTYANIKAVTGGIIEASGTAKNQKVSLLTGGIYKGETVDTEKTEVSINAAGEAYIKASQLADIKIRAGGDVFVYGNPKTVNESKVLGGRIKRME